MPATSPAPAPSAIPAPEPNGVPDAVAPLSTLARDAIRRWWRHAPDGSAIARRFAVAGAVWSLIAVGLAFGGTVSLALGWPLPGGGLLGFGRLDAAYVLAVFFGAISLPLAGGGLLAAGMPQGDAAVRRRARLAWEVWNAGLAAAVAAALAGWTGPSGSVWSVALPVGAVLWLGAALWAWSLGSLATAGPVPPLAGVRIGVVAAVALVAYLGLGVALAPAVPGAGAVFVDALVMPGLVHVWAIPAALGVAATVGPAALGAPLYGRQALLWGVGAWLVLGALGVPRDLAPDLAPAWLGRLSVAASAGLLAPAVVLAIALLGTRLGGTWRSDVPEAAAPGHEGAAGAAGDRLAGPARPVTAEGWAGALMLAGVAVALAATAVDASTTPGSKGLVQLTAWQAGHAWLPPFAGLHMAALGAGMAVLRGTGIPIGARTARRQAVMVAAGLLLVALALAVVGLAEAAASLGATLAAVGVKAAAPPPGGDLVRLEAWLRLPGTAVLGLAALSWAVRAVRAPQPGAAAAAGPALVGGPGGVAPNLGAVLVVFGAALMITVFVPIARGQAAPAPDVDGDAVGHGLRLEGKQRYQAERCIACHTQRVRDTLDAVRFGARRPAGDGLPGPILAGQRRAGPDLTWVGERYGGPDGLARRLAAVHGPRGTPPMPWLFEAGGPTGAGTAIIGYLDGLRRPTARSAAPDGVRGATTADATPPSTPP